MKKTITKLTMALGLFATTTVAAQTNVTFDLFSLAADTFYQDINSHDFSSNGVTFRYDWSSWGTWGGGTAYTNKKDTIFTAQTVAPYYANLYSCIPGVAFSGNNYATAQTGAIVTFSNNTTALSGFYVTNTTYVWKSIKNGDMFARKFGDTTGTGSGTSIPQGEYPDWYKLLVRGFRGGNMITDSVEFYLADYRAAGTANDYVLKNWQFVNCASLGQVDSIMFVLKSSDVGQWGINTPTYFSFDNFSTQTTVGIKELSSVSKLNLQPNPANDYVVISYEANSSDNLQISISDISGKEINNISAQTSIGLNQITLNTENYQSGVYFVTITNGVLAKTVKLIKL